MDNFNILWQDVNAATIVKRADLQQFATENVNRRGQVVIIVLGTPRYVKWRSIGAGLYKVWTFDKEKE